VTGRVDQVDQKLVLCRLARNILEVLRVNQGGKQRDGSGLDGDTTFLLVRTSVGETLLTSLCCGDDTSALDEGVGEGRFSVVD